LDQNFDRLADPLAKDRGKFCLSFTAVEDGLEKRRDGVLCGRDPELRGKQGAQSGDLGGEDALLEP
jgi:hypothetical protein